MSLIHTVHELHRQWQRFWSHSSPKPHATRPRACRFEPFEKRQLLSFTPTPIQVGAVYYEDAGEEDTTGDQIEITWQGGQPGTQLTKVIIDTDKGGDGLSVGDAFFDTATGGLGDYGSFPLTIVSHDGFEVLSATVVDGGTKLELTFRGFDAGEKLVLSVDVDEQGYPDPLDPNPANSVCEGKEFQSSKFITTFSSPGYYDTTGSVNFYDHYSVTPGLNLPVDSYVPPGSDPHAERTAGAFQQLTQTPLPSSIAGTVFEDTDLDNVRDTGEKGIAGVTLSLWELVNGEYVNTGKTAITDANGNYKFDSVTPGTYRIAETQPSGYFSVGAKAGKVGGATRGEVTTVDVISSVSLIGGEDSVSNDFAEAKPATLSGYVYHDADNDGVRDSGETGIAGATVRVTYLAPNGTSTTTQVQTDANGYWAVSGLMPGDYRVEEVQPSGYLDGLDAAGTAGGVAHNPGDSITGVHLTSGQSGQEYNFGEILPSSISGRVVADANANGVYDPGDTLLSGVTVYLLDSTGKRIASTTTDANGEYSFNGLAPGVYGVEEVQPQGYYDGVDRVGSAGGSLLPPDSIIDVQLASGTDGIRYDFYELLASSISGHVIADNNNNSVFDEGDQLLAGVTVYLLDSSGNRIASTVTDIDGAYAFNDLAPGTYGVEEVQPQGYYDGPDFVGSAGGSLSPPDSIRQISLISGTEGTDYDFFELLPVSLSGYVYVDNNNNGIRDPGESPISGVTLKLLDANGNPTGRTATTDSNGYYRFDGLAPGQVYGVSEVQPTGYRDGLDSAGTAGGIAHNPGDSITDISLPPGVNGKNYNFGEILPSSIAGQVVVDANGNGKVDSGETPLAGVTIWLLDADGNRITSTTTDSNGWYVFRDLLPGTYGVEEVQPSGYFDGEDLVGSAGGAHSANDKITSVTLDPGVNATDYDFLELLPGSISGYVFQSGPTVSVRQGDALPDPQTLSDGRFRPGDKPIAGVVLKLCDGSGAAIVDAYGNPITTVTDVNGYYQFTGLEPGLYSILEVQPSGYYDSVDRAGSSGGIAINPHDTIDPMVLSTLAVDPHNDAIVRIWVGAGQSAVEYNFSEVKIVTQPTNGGGGGPPVVPSPPSIPSPPVTSFVGVPVLCAYYMTAPVQHIYSTLAGGGGTSPVAYTWHLSVVDGGQPRRENEGSKSVAESSSVYFNPVSWNGSDMNRAEWVVMGLDGKVVKKFVFGIEGARPIVGDFDGNGTTDIGVFFDGLWFLDLNGNGVWDDGDLWVRLGKEGDQPVAGDWDGDGKTDLGIFGPLWAGDSRAVAHEPGLPDSDNYEHSGRYKNVPPKPEEATLGWRTMKRTAQGKLRADLIDHVFQYGSEGDVAVSGDWNGDGISNIGLFRDGTWYLDADGNGRWSPGDIYVESFGAPGDIPVVGDWTGDGVDKLGVYRNGTWYLDTNNNHILDAGDKTLHLGGPHDRPFVGDFNGDGIDEIGVYKDGRYPQNKQASEPGQADGPAEEVATRPDAPTATE